MRITCPACAAAYEVPDRLIGAGGRRLRCRQCGHDWEVQPPGAAEPPPAPGPAPAPPPLAAPPPPPSPVPLPLASPLASALAPAQPPRLPQPISPPLPQDPQGRWRGGLALRLAWAASLLLLGLLSGLAWLFRAEIVTAWPPAGRLLQLAGG